VDGFAESDTVAGSDAKTTTRYFGNGASGDLNGDGKADTAFLLTQVSGGTGVFYYVTVALASGNGVQGLNAILLGDRIAPQTTEINDGKITVNYADRKSDDPFSIAPSVGVSRHFQVTQDQLTEIQDSSADSRSRPN
jgi:hypothetical protein